MTCLILYSISESGVRNGADSQLTVDKPIEPAGYVGTLSNI